MKTLVIPFQINCLHTTEEVKVAEATANFSSIPYFDVQKGRTMNSSNPYLSENILSQPFQNQNLILEKGVHLHFILPTQLTSPVKVLDKAGNTQKKYPAVPNRWLVIKKTGTQQKEWIIESDYLWKETEPSSQTRHKITVPLPIDLMKEDPSLSQPYRAMGRTYTLEEWEETGGRGVYWEAFFEEPLTALGYGNEAFAGFFPNCKDVFSFYDDSEYKAIGEEVIYEVYGWHSQANYAQELTKFYEQSPLFSDMRRIDAFEKEYNWAIHNETGELPSSLLFYSSVVLGRKSHESTVKNEKTEVAIGNTGTEALTAFLAKKIAPDQKSQAENKLEAVQLEALFNQKTDITAKFEAARLAKSFTAKPSGILWSLEVQQRQNTEKSGQSAEFATDLQRLLADVSVADLYHDAALILSILNDIQQQYDKNHHQIESKRHQLFADWYKYMLSAHPPIGQAQDYPRADDVLQFINRYVIRGLNEQMQATGFVEKEIEEDGGYLFKTTFNEGLAADFVNEFDELQRQLYVLNNEITAQKGMRNTPEAIQNGKSEFLYPALVNEKITFKLLPKAAPRFYEANEPVVLLAGEAAKPTNPLVDYTLDCYFVALDLRDLFTVIDTLKTEPLPVSVASMQTTLAELMPPRAIHAQDWNPTLLEWEVEYIPVDDPSDEPQGYPSDFLQANYDLPLGAQVLALKKEAPTDFSNKIRYYRGSTILTDYAKAALAQKFKQFLKKPTLKNDETIIAAADYLKKISVLSQSLGGFNQALLMRKQTLQLEVDDPIALASYEPLIANIRAYIGNAVKSAPEPKHYFNPLRAGGMNISRLNIIDAFGQVVEVFNKNKTEAPIIANLLTPKEALQNRFQVVLPPRVVQPTRLHFRWIAGEDDSIETNEHPVTTPVCGWLAPNFVEETIALFNAEGVLLGSIGYVDDNIYPIPKSGSDTFLLSEIKNKHFRSVVEHTLYQGVDYFYDWLSEIRDSLEFIDPENASQDSEMALLMGRPLAVVRAAADVQLMEDYAINQDWNIFRKDVNNVNNPKYQRTTYGFENVKIPLRLGDSEQLNDGLVGFWRNDAPSKVVGMEDKFYLPLSQKETAAHHKEQSEYMVTAGEADFLFYQSLADAPQYLTLLFDPRCQLNLSAGILPVKTINLPSVHFRKALANMAMQFLVAPILTPRGKLQMPLPKTTDSLWHWVYLENSKLKEITSVPTVERRTVEQAWEAHGGSEKYYLWGSLIEANWIQPLKDDVTKAAINYDMATRQKLPVEYDEAFINQVFSHFYQAISPVVTDAQFGQVEIREGWLKAQ